jgi:hypothetical protein
MQKKGRFIFFILVAFAISYGIKSVTLELPAFLLLQNYLFDLLFPAGFGISILIIGALFGKTIDYRNGVLISFILAFIYEIIQMFFGKGDPYDFIAYFLGMMLYFLIFREENFHISFSILEEQEKDKTERVT